MIRERCIALAPAPPYSNLRYAKTPWQKQADSL